MSIQVDDTDKPRAQDRFQAEAASYVPTAVRSGWAARDQRSVRVVLARVAS